MQAAAGPETPPGSGECCCALLLLLLLQQQLLLLLLLLLLLSHLSDEVCESDSIVCCSEYVFAVDCMHFFINIIFFEFGVFEYISESDECFFEVYRHQRKNKSSSEFASVCIRMPPLLMNEIQE